MSTRQVPAPELPVPSEAELAAERKVARVCKPLAIAGPFVVLAVCAGIVWWAIPQLPDMVQLTSTSRGGGDHVVPRGQVWQVLAAPGVLSFVALIAVGSGFSRAEKLAAQRPGTAWAFAAALLWGMPLLGTVGVADVLAQVGRPTGQGPNGSIFLSPILALATGWLIVKAARGRIRRGSVSGPCEDVPDAPH